MGSFSRNSKGEKGSVPPDEVLYPLEDIGRIKSKLPLSQRGWCDVLGLYVQYRSILGRARLQAGEKRKVFLDARQREPFGPWEVKKYEPGEWERLVIPTYTIAQSIYDAGGLTEEMHPQLMEAVHQFKTTGELKLPIFKRGR